MDMQIRSQQRFSNYKKALTQLTEFVAKENLNKLAEQGVIQAFEYTDELAWKTLADFLKEKGNSEIYGSKDATGEAFSLGLEENGEIWMQMIQSRNLTSHTYNDGTAKQIVEAIKNSYFAEFESLKAKLDSKQK